ncbi:response regulator [Flavobacterium sp. MAH-1]|uniref:Response regulator n=1 Tax=Flavobacterium agri TaxID=2743471 RepID=A0A7Y9C441_9FLAO|nr:response regulator [Flavobacterium agri]NUY79485.1 response regulator [Flavobacterium agri]NYA69510.1 response regulator [Flavobacterium agri]
MIHDKNIVEILLVDDDQDDRSIFSDALSELKIETSLNMLEDGRDLVAYLEDTKNKRPDILFLDLNMPYKSGVECLKEIRTIDKFKDLSVAIYSTSNSEKDMEDTFINGANIYIRKPNDFTQLKKVLTEVLSINWQFHTSALNKETFLLNI